MSRYKVGDKVRMTRTVGNDNGTFPQGTVGCVVKAWNGASLVEMPSSEDGKEYTSYFLNYNLERVIAPDDKKREFLERLQALLREFNAEIVASIWQKDAMNTKPLMQIDIDGQKPIIYENTLHNGYVFVNANNIMDFDKG